MCACGQVCNLELQNVRRPRVNTANHASKSSPRTIQSHAKTLISCVSDLKTRTLVKIWAPTACRLVVLTLKTAVRRDGSVKISRIVTASPTVKSASDSASARYKAAGNG